MGKGFCGKIGGRSLDCLRADRRSGFDFERFDVKCHGFDGSFFDYKTDCRLLGRVVRLQKI